MCEFNFVVLSSTMYNMWYLLWHMLELSVKSTCFHALFGPAFTPYPLFQWYLQNNETLLNLSLKS